jgi:hypothetical protein
MSTNDFLRLRESIERRLQEYGNFIVPGLGMADRVASQLRWIEEAEAREARFRAIVEEGQQKGERTRAMLLDIG